MTRGRVFHIQKFSIHDGPGIRTTVFLKGCPLQCRWCSNPESQQLQARLLWDKTTCSHCSCCVEVCERGAICFDGDILYRSAGCTGCEACVTVCPENAWTVDSQAYTVQEILAICFQDRDFYAESGGGVTVSGGEAFLQFPFLLSLLKALKQANIHTVVETTGHAETENLLAAAPYIDLFLYDVKHYESAAHLAGTGVGNQKILRNLEILLEKGYAVLPRIPVIPDFNETRKDAAGFAKLLNGMKIKTVQLLPFHQFGEKKYELLSQEYAYQNFKAIYPEELKNYLKTFHEKGLEAYI